MKKIILFFLVFSLMTTQSYARPLLTLVDIQGVRENQLVGYGLVVGLSGTGDKNQTKFTSQSVKNMLSQFGVQLDAKADPKLRNVAAVAVHATLPALVSKGQTIDVTVSSLGDAKSLRGGTLLLTPIKGLDGQIYAVAQGNLVVDGIKAEGKSGSNITVNTPTVGLIPNGAIVEREVTSSFQTDKDFILNLKDPGFKTARQIESKINKLFGEGIATAENHAKIRVKAPVDKSHRVAFLAALEEVTITPVKKFNRVIMNSRTGTIVVGKNVRVHSAAVSHGNLTVSVSEQSDVSQPNAFADGRTAVTPNSNISIDSEKTKAFILPDISGNTSLQTVVDAVNGLGATTADLMSILIALDEAGAIDGELIIL